jgi:hypothetical protein
VPVPLIEAASALSAPFDLAELIRSGFDHNFVKLAHLPVTPAVDRVPDTRSQMEPATVRSYVNLPPAKFVSLSYTSGFSSCFPADVTI